MRENHLVEPHEETTEVKSETFEKAQNDAYLYSKDPYMGIKDTNDLTDSIHFDKNHLDEKENDGVLEKDEFSCKKNQLQIISHIQLEKECRIYSL